LGLTNYFRGYIPNYADLCYPLYRLLKKDYPFIWTDTEEKSFQALKKALSSRPILAFPNLLEEMILTTDASDTYFLQLIYDKRWTRTNYIIRGQRFETGGKELLCLRKRRAFVFNFRGAILPRVFTIEANF